MTEEDSQRVKRRKRIVTKERIEESEEESDKAENRSEGKLEERMKALEVELKKTRQENKYVVWLLESLRKKADRILGDVDDSLQILDGEYVEETEEVDEDESESDGAETEESEEDWEED